MDRLKKIDELRRTLNELRELGASIKENFPLFEKFISQEKFPEVKLIEKVGNNFLTWASNVNKSFELYEELFDGDKPRTFSELEKILGAEEKKIIEANIFAQAEKFLHLTTKNSDVKKILEGHQKKLKALLAKKSRDEVEPYAKFIEATTTNDCVKKFSLGKELSDIFGDEFIGRALIGKELFFEDELDISNDDSEPLVDDKKSDDEKSDDKKSVDKKSVYKKTDDKKSVDKKSFVEIADETLPNEMLALDEMFFAKKFYCATAYLKALSLQDDGYTPLYYQLAYAINDPFLAISYDADKILTLFENSQSPEEYFLTAATLRTFFITTSNLITA